MNKADTFDFAKVGEFDKHINLSIPNYTSLCNIFLNITKEFMSAETKVVDLGCSTGKFLSSLDKIEDCEYIGIDTLDFADRKQGFKFLQKDAETIKDIDSCSVIISMFFLQFLGEPKRKRMLKLIKEKVEKGCVLLISEKVLLEDTRIQTVLHKMHLQEKRKGFSDKEILDKDLRLGVTMYCKTQNELLEELKEIGNPTQVWQSYGFVGYVVKKRR